MNRSGMNAAGLATAALLANGVFAMELGEASGRAVLGQPLHLEIPVIGANGGATPRNCFRLRAPRAEVGNDFAVRNARIEMVGAKLVVTTATAVSEPVVGFAVEAACAGVFRDYVLLAGLPAAPPPAPVVDTPRAAGPVETIQPAKATTTVSPDDALRIAAPLTLEALARQKYPLQPKAREKFMRMMMEANPGLISIDTPMAAGTQLRVPAGLPQRRVGPYLGESKAAPQQQPAPATAAAAPTTTARSAPAPKPGKDRLVLGRAPESNEAQLLAEAERLTNLLIGQFKVQDDMTASLDRMEADYAALRKQLVEMQTRLARMEAERAAEKQAAKDSELAQLVELIVAILGGGAVGGIGLHLFQRRRLQEKADDEGFGNGRVPAPPAAPPVPPSAKPAVPPWAVTSPPVSKEGVAARRDAAIARAAEAQRSQGSSAERRDMLDFRKR